MKCQCDTTLLIANCIRNGIYGNHYLPFSCFLHSMTIHFTSCSNTILQKSLTVVGSGV